MFIGIIRYFVINMLFIKGYSSIWVPLISFWYGRPGGEDAMYNRRRTPFFSEDK
jgi:hypothetical protein